MSNKDKNIKHVIFACYLIASNKGNTYDLHSLCQCIKGSVLGWQAYNSYTYVQTVLSCYANKLYFNNVIRTIQIWSTDTF
jgi:hypothetical protein